jgi:hypothetical protein
LLVVGSLVGTGAIVVRQWPASDPSPSSPPASPTTASPGPGPSPPAPTLPVTTAVSAPSPGLPAPPGTGNAPPRLVARALTAPAVTTRASSNDDVLPSSATASGPATVAAETQLLRDADGALRAGQAVRALALLDEHAARFPRGVLVEERNAERIVVLCALGEKSQAREAGSAFLREHSGSPLGARVRASCALQ